MEQENSHPYMKRMEVIDILRYSMHGSGEDPKKYYAALSQLVEQDKNFRVMRANNTLFSYYNKGNGEVDMTMDTADDPRTLIKSIQEFEKAMKISGFKKAVFEIDNPQVTKLMDIAHIQYSLDGNTVTVELS